ncbi:UPF0162 protein like [Actinidia chinensis var. chinensis]|uniref:UPF0162 protein like n=1 Tax=Actinidia chinensis var. chinensis TaxID=1590841 RepID=A0A2R6PIM4_ACTCC|nr:UPF0162 protein like [Actinidia chinensis var. chinensis]
MSCVLLTGGTYIDHRPFRYDYNPIWCWNGDEQVKKNKFTSTLIGSHKRMRLRFSPMASSALATSKNLSLPKFYQEVLEVARERFTEEISFQSKDKDISLAKALLYIAAEDEAFMAFYREMDAHSLQIERSDASVSSDGPEWECLEQMPLAGKRINEWLTELDTIAKEVMAELESRDIGCHLVEVLEAVNLVLFKSRGFKRSPVLVDPKYSYLHSVLEAVNLVLFKSRGFKRSPVLVDPKYSYLHSVLNSGNGSAILLSIIYIEICRRLNLTIVGSRVGEDFLIWPQNGNPEELFKVTSGHSLFGVVNGKCMDDPKSKASDLRSNSLSGLDIATNRDIIGIALANLIRLHWKRASRTNHGLMLTSPLRPVHDNDKLKVIDGSNVPLVRPQDLRLAIMASERLLILQPHNWALRRDHGMMLYYSREYKEAVRELSICMAFAPEEEAEVLEPFVEKLHLLRLESSWKSLGHKGSLKVT